MDKYVYLFLTQRCIPSTLFISRPKSAKKYTHSCNGNSTQAIKVYCFSFYGSRIYQIVCVFRNVEVLAKYVNVFIKNNFLPAFNGINYCVTIEACKTYFCRKGHLKVQKFNVFNTMKRI